MPAAATATTVVRNRMIKAQTERPTFQSRKPLSGPDDGVHFSPVPLQVTFVRRDATSL